jgi:hypothetical protein
LGIAPPEAGARGAAAPPPGERGSSIVSWRRGDRATRQPLN